VKAVVVALVGLKATVKKAGFVGGIAGVLSESSLFSLSLSMAVIIIIKKK